MVLNPGIKHLSKSPKLYMCFKIICKRINDIHTSITRGTSWSSNSLKLHMPKTNNYDKQ